MVILMKKKDNIQKPISENQNNRKSLMSTDKGILADKEITTGQAALAETEVLDKIALTDQMPIFPDTASTEQMPGVHDLAEDEADQQPQSESIATNEIETPEKPVLSETTPMSPVETLPHSAAPRMLSKQSLQPETSPGPDEYHQLHPDRAEGKLRTAWSSLFRPGKRWVKPTMLVVSGVALFGLGLLTGSLVVDDSHGPHNRHHHFPPHLEQQVEGSGSKFGSRPGPEDRTFPSAPGKPGGREIDKSNSDQTGENPGPGDHNSSSDTKENQSGEPKQMTPSEPNTESSLPNQGKENNGKNNKNDKNNN